MMMRQQRLIPATLIGTVLLSMLLGVCLLSWKRFLKAKPASKVKKHKVKQSSEDVLNYWTPDKMRKAEGAPMPTTDAVKRARPDRDA